MDFDGGRAFGSESVRLAQQTSAYKAQKPTLRAVGGDFDVAVQAYKAGNAQELKSLVRYFLLGNKGGTCALDNDILGTYCFPHNVDYVARTLCSGVFMTGRS